MLSLIRYIELFCELVKKIFFNEINIQTQEDVNILHKKSSSLHIFNFIRPFNSFFELIIFVHAFFFHDNDHILIDFAL